jgi:predicted RNA binding protein YcfA (HicA-like mRNA interferase family)
MTPLNDDGPLPQVNAREVIAVLEFAGFHLARTSGSHAQYKKEGHRYVVTVPQHGSKSLKPGTLRSIIKGAGLTKGEFNSFLELTR